MRWLANMFPLDQHEQQAQYRFIDLAKSATGSTFFSYCWHSELVLRKKHMPSYWGDGPDLIIIETGINDVVSPSDFTTKASSQSYEDDFESLLWQLKSLPSRPAIVVLDAASRLLDKRQALHESAEFTTHLGPSVWLDVPVISAKTGLLIPEGQRDLEKLGDLYLAE